MDKGTKGKIINSVRKLTYAYPPRNNAKSRQKVAPATFECVECETWIYEGVRDLTTLDLKPPKGLIKGKIYMDHIEPVIPLSGFLRGSWDWNEYLERMFCETEGFQAICYDCHKNKTYLEDQIRKEYRQKKKLDKV
jgi:hypothetical protein